MTIGATVKGGLIEFSLGLSLGEGAFAFYLGVGVGGVGVGVGVGVLGVMFGIEVLALGGSTAVVVDRSGVLCPLS